MKYSLLLLIFSLCTLSFCEENKKSSTNNNSLEISEKDSLSPTVETLLIKEIFPTISLNGDIYKNSTEEIYISDTNSKVPSAETTTEPVPLEVTYKIENATIASENNGNVNNENDTQIPIIYSPSSVDENQDTLLTNKPNISALDLDEITNLPLFIVSPDDGLPNNTEKIEDDSSTQGNLTSNKEDSSFNPSNVQSFHHDIHDNDSNITELTEDLLTTTISSVLLNKNPDLSNQTLGKELINNVSALVNESKTTTSKEILSRTESTSSLVNLSSSEFLTNTDISESNSEHDESNKVKAESIRIEHIDKSINFLIKNNSTDIKETKLLKIRKCCDDKEYFNIDNQKCQHSEDVDFNSMIKPILGKKDNGIKISFQVGALKLCPNGALPSITMDISNITHLIEDTGTVINVNTQEKYLQDSHCFETVGSNAQSSALTLAFCSTQHETFDYYDYPSDSDVVVAKNINDISKSVMHVVRKCCEENEYYDIILNKCSESKMNNSNFKRAVQKITFENKEIDLHVISQRIYDCPENSVDKRIVQVDPNAFRLDNNGDIIEIVTGLRYNYSYYCMEMVGTPATDMSFNIVFCSLSYPVPKCCPVDHYFDEIHLDCVPIERTELRTVDLFSKYNADSQFYSMSPLKDFFHCESSFPVKESADNLHILNAQLCEHSTCYDKSKYCLDYIGHTDDITPSAFYCQREYYIKCCGENQILSSNGCIPHDSVNSIMMQQLINTRTYRNSFNSNACRKGEALLIDANQSPKIQWWVSHDGSFLTVSSDVHKKKLYNYCIDDFMDSENNIGPSAYVCESDVTRLLPNEHHFLKYSKEGSLGKCCPDNLVDGYVYYFSLKTNDCESIAWNATLRNSKYFEDGLFKEEHFHDFPECSNGVLGHHKYSFVPGSYDYAKMSQSGELKIISPKGKCIQETTIQNKDFCIEYILDEYQFPIPSAFICASEPEPQIYSSKFSIITMFLGISCFFLFASLIFLLTMKVRRGFVTVKKVETLAGRILLSFVASHFIGFLTLALTQHENLLNRGDTVACHVLAGFVQFFNLATFFWNSSICLESLLLTIDINISKCLRYVLHCLWSWGTPMVITLIMFLVDAYEEDLPCWVITPKIGELYCFHSDNDAIVVYFYLPILFTLLFNVSFIFIAKGMRRRRLQRLERGIPKKNSTPGSQVENKTEGSQAASGMRTHQSRNTKSESLRIVVWTGGTWFLELLGYFIKRYGVGHTQDYWYEYLWYIPISLNALRGVGIFVIIVLTPEKRKEINTFIKTTRTKMKKMKIALADSFEYDASNRSASMNHSTNNHAFVGNERQRNMSVSTMISNLSSSFYNTSTLRRNGDNSRKSSIASYFSIKLENLRKPSVTNRNSSLSNGSLKNTSVNHNSRATRKNGMVRSASQIDTYLNSTMEEQEPNEGIVQRKCSVALPKVQEEESVFESEADGGINLCETEIAEPKHYKRDNKPSVIEENNSISDSDSETAEENDLKRRNEEITIAVIEGFSKTKRSISQTSSA